MYLKSDAFIQAHECLLAYVVKCIEVFNAIAMSTLSPTTMTVHYVLKYNKCQEISHSIKQRSSITKDFLWHMIQLEYATSHHSNPNTA